MATVRPVCQKIASVAAGMVEGEIDLLEGCRAIVRLRGSLSDPEQSDPDLLVFVAVESEVDDMPFGLARQHWAPEALVEKDRQKAEYLGAARQDILRACRVLITKWAVQV